MKELIQDGACLCFLDLPQDVVKEGFFLAEQGVEENTVQSKVLIVVEVDTFHQENFLEVLKRLRIAGSVIL